MVLWVSFPRAVRGLVPIVPVPLPEARGQPPEGCPARLPSRPEGCPSPRGTWQRTRPASARWPGAHEHRGVPCPAVWQSRATGPQNRPPWPSRHLAILCFSFNIYADSGVKSQPPLGLSGVWPVCRPRRQPLVASLLCRIALMSFQKGAASAGGHRPAARPSAL